MAHTETPLSLTGQQPNPQQGKCDCLRAKAHRVWMEEGLDHLDLVDDLTQENLSRGYGEDLQRLSRFIRTALQRERIRYHALTP